jgi:uncharacterized protein (TIGR00255 family)
MTGFANIAATLFEHAGEQCVVDIEIKTFNSKFFEPSCKLPGALSGYEMEITSRLKNALLRGRVYCTLRIASHGALLEKMIFSPARVEEYLAAGSYITKHFGVTGSLTVAELMTLPQVFAPERAVLSDQAVARLFEGLDAAIAQVQQARQLEGQSLLVDLEQRLVLMSQIMERITSIVAKVLVEQKEEIAEQQKLAQEGDELAKAVLPERLGMLDKMDVHEEIVRFQSHMNALRQLLASALAEKGRKLDFMLQELMREVNTITSKCMHFEMSSAAVDIKVEIEKIREQIQNIV